jgi:dolichol-phosphate mannosyltransferase
MFWIILPTYNEAENIVDLIEAIAHLNLPKLHMLVIDDSSPDGTATLVDALKDKYPVELVSRPRKMGLGSAYVFGFKKALSAGADYIMEMDSDFSHNPKDIPALLGAVQVGADLAIGSRRVNGGGIEGWNWWRKFMSRGATEFSRIFLKLKTKDVTAGFRCYRADFLKQIPLGEIKSNGYSFQEEMIFLVEKLKGKVTEVPVIFVDRAKGKSKLSYKEIIKFFWIIFLLRRKYAYIKH